MTPGPVLLDYADPFVTEDAPGRTCWDVTFEDLEVGATDRCLGDPHDCVTWILDLRNRPLFQCFLV